MELSRTLSSSKLIRTGVGKEKPTWVTHVSSAHMEVQAIEPDPFGSEAHQATVDLSDHFVTWSISQANSTFVSVTHVGQNTEEEATFLPFGSCTVHLGSRTIPHGPTVAERTRLKTDEISGGQAPCGH